MLIVLIPNCTALLTCLCRTEPRPLVLYFEFQFSISISLLTLLPCSKDAVFNRSVSTWCASASQRRLMRPMAQCRVVQLCLYVATLEFSMLTPHVMPRWSWQLHHQGRGTLLTTFYGQNTKALQLLPHMGRLLRCPSPIDDQDSRTNLKCTVPQSTYSTCSDCHLLDWDASALPSHRQINRAMPEVWRAVCITCLLLCVVGD